MGKLRREGSMVRPNKTPVELGTCSGLREKGFGRWMSLGCSSPKSMKKHKVGATMSNLCRRAKLCLTILTEMPGAGAIFSYLAVWPYAAGLSLASLWNDATQALWEAMHSPAVLGAEAFSKFLAFLLEGATAKRLRTTAQSMPQRL